MPDVWSTTAELDSAMQERLADVLELRGADGQQQAMRRSFLDSIEVSVGAPVLEVGCGTGVLTRQLARRPAVGSVVGVDVAPGLLKRARALAADLENVTFQQADARELPFAAESFSAVVFDSTLSHVPTPERALAEASRVLIPAGVLAIFDGDYATATVALGDDDPLQACVDAMIASSVTDRWLVRRLPMLALAAGFVITSLSSYGFVDVAGGSYMLSIVDRGADLLVADGRASDETADALKAEARRRVENGAFFGHIAYAGLLARKQSATHASQMHVVADGTTRRP